MTDVLFNTLEVLALFALAVSLIIYFVDDDRVDDEELEIVLIDDHRGYVLAPRPYDWKTDDLGADV